MANSSELLSTIADRWLSVDDVAAYLGIKRDTVYKWIDRRRMPAHKVGRLWKLRKQEIDAWVCSEIPSDVGNPNKKNSSGVPKRKRGTKKG
jgi:excisionase family DNA binding protein